MLSIGPFIALIWVHFVADFILQTDYIAINKSKSNWVLSLHVALYMIPMCIFGVTFAIVNAILHFVTDWATSRCTSYLWRHNQRHWFFTVIGLDQAIHMTCLLTTYAMLGSV